MSLPTCESDDKRLIDVNQWMLSKQRLNPAQMQGLVQLGLARFYVPCF